MKKIFLILLSIISTNVNSQNRLQSELALRDYVDHIYSKSLYGYQNLSKYKDAGDLFLLAQHYLYGQGTNKDISLAVKYLKMASDRGYLMAQALLCYLMYDAYRNEKSLYPNFMNDLYKFSILLLNTNLLYINNL